MNVSPNPQKCRVLIVDDEPANRKLLADLVTRDGFQAVTAADGAEALAELERQPCDLVLLDLMMPGVDGMGVLAEMQRRGLLPRLPVVIVTARDDRTMRGKALTAGAIDYLTKPVDHLEVQCKVRALTELSRLRAAAVVQLERAASEQQLARVEEAVAGLPVVIFESNWMKEGSDSDDWLVGDSLTHHGLSRAEFFDYETRISRIHPDDRPQFEARLVATEPADASVRSGRFRALVRGEYRWFLHSISRDKVSGQLRGVTLDIDEQVSLEEQLRQTQKIEAIGMLASGISHDFNNLLSVIQSYAGFLRDAMAPEDERRADVLEILKAADGGVNLTRQLLTFSRPDETTTRPVDLGESLQRLDQLLAHALGAQVKLELELPRRPAVVLIDPSQFDQLVLNLAINARDAMPDGGRLHIAVKPSARSGLVGTDIGGWRLVVTDTGTGMSDATRERIFNPFFSTKAPGKGTGLGLATVHAIVKGAGGTIRVASAMGRGTTFTVELPACAGAPETQVAPELERRRYSSGTVLIAEDQPALLRVTSRILESAGYAVHLAADGDEARHKLDEIGPSLDLLLTDIEMPGCSGYDVADHAARTAPEAAVVFTSGYVAEARRHRRTPDSQMLWKPVPARDLLDAVAAAMDARTARAGLPPAAAAPAPVLVAAQTTSAGPRRERILVVDDDPGLAAVSARMLAGERLDVVLAASLATARSTLADGEFDAVLLDVGLPDGDGLDLLRELRGRDCEVPVIVMTGAPSVASAAQAIRSRISAYLPKPFTHDELRRAVRSSVDAGRLASLRAKLLSARFGGEEFVRDISATELVFERALASLRMVFQPIVRAKDSTVYAYEALLRCDESTLASPLRLLAAADVLGRVRDVGQRVRALVAATLTEHHGRTDTIFVNMHPGELRAELLEDVAEALLPFAKRVVLEVTERAAVEGGVRLDGELARIRALGYRIAVDDLGEGFAGLSSLVHLRPEIVKIDMSLVRNIDSSPLRRDIVMALMDMAWRAGILVVAEGVETMAERDVLVELGCDLLQGYLFAKPGPPFPLVQTVFPQPEAVN